MGDGEIVQKDQWLKNHWSFLLTGVQYDNTALQGDTADRVTAVYTIFAVKSVDAEFGKAEKRLRDTSVDKWVNATAHPRTTK